MHSKSTTTHFLNSEQEFLLVSDKVDSVFVQYFDKFSSISTESFYALDLQKKQFCYIKPDSLFLCGYSIKYAIEKGLDFYNIIVYHKDFQQLKNMYEAVIKCLDNIEEEKRNEIDYFSCTFRLLRNYSFLIHPLSQMIYHKMKPIWKAGELCYLICSVESSIAKEAGNLQMHKKELFTYEEYNFKTRRWKSKTIGSLNERESAIITLALQGKSGREIANNLYIGYKTFRNILSRLYKKLGVKSMYEAIIVSSNQNMIMSYKKDIEKLEKSYIEESYKKSRTLLNAVKLQFIQKALDSGMSIRQIAKRENISESAIRYWIKHGKLNKSH